MDGVFLFERGGRFFRGCEGRKGYNNEEQSDKEEINVLFFSSIMLDVHASYFPF